MNDVGACLLHNTAYQLLDSRQSATVTAPPPGRQEYRRSYIKPHLDFVSQRGALFQSSSSI